MFTSAEHAVAYMLAGNATFTIKSLSSGSHYTFKMRKAEDNELWFVSVLHGQTNEYMGVVDGNPKKFRTTAKSTFNMESPCVKAFVWCFRQLTERHAIPDTLQIQHEGTCGKCGRPLTHPESIERGIGPVCGRGGWDVESVVGQESLF